MVWAALILVCLVWLLGLVRWAFAEFQVPDHISIDMGTLGSLVLMMLGALATVWVLRKVIKVVNRS